MSPSSAADDDSVGDLDHFWLMTERNGPSEPASLVANQPFGAPVISGDAYADGW